MRSPRATARAIRAAEAVARRLPAGSQERRCGPVEPASASATERLRPMTSTGRSERGGAASRDATAATQGRGARYPRPRGGSIRAGGGREKRVELFLEPRGVRLARDLQPVDAHAPLERERPDTHRPEAAPVVALERALELRRVALRVDLARDVAGLEVERHADPLARGELVVPALRDADEAALAGVRVLPDAL